jgi:tetratricopeptide (TPR) repeat protein
MSSVFFDQFNLLWERVEAKFTNENSEPFSLENLHSQLSGQGLALRQIDLENIKKKFLEPINQDKIPENINLSDNIYKVLFDYIGVIGFPDLIGLVNHEEVLEEIRAKRKSNKTKIINDRESDFVEIGFLGRRAELNELEEFLLAPEKIFCLYGVPMIGKSTLLNYFLENNKTAITYKHITAELKPGSENEQIIKEKVFGNKDFNDFSDFSSKTLIVIQNFEEALKWTGDYKKLHDIKNNYPKIRKFLQEAVKIDNIKIIIESRFQIRLEALLTDWRKKVKTLSKLQLEGVERKEFWRFYKDKGFSHEEFRQLCEDFNDHTWLLSLAYSDYQWLYDNNLIEAFHEPTLTTIYLWGYIEDIIKRLKKQEILILCALTHLQEPVEIDSLYEDFSSIPDFKDKSYIRDAFVSLRKKFMVQLEQGFYQLNPYIREVCYTFLEDTRKSQMQIISSLPYLKKHGKTPVYSKIRKAHGRRDHMFLFNLGRELRKERDYDKAIEAFEAGLTIDPKKENVLTEIAITYKKQEKWHKAIEALKKANEIKPKDVKTLNELGICYRENNQLKEAVGVLEEANKIKPKDVKTLNELGICYRENNQLKEAIKTLEKAKEINPDEVIILNELAICYRENNQLDKAIETLEKAKEIDSKDVKTLNELAICYRENGDYEDSIKIAKKAINLRNYPSYTVLAITYQKMGDIQTAYSLLEEGMRIPDWKKTPQTKRYFQELKLLVNQQEQEKSIKKLKVFLSYSHKDEDVKEELDNHLSALKRSDKISTWNDRELPAGAEWDKAIKDELENADIVLLLISKDFIKSDYIWNIEIKRAIEKHDKGTAVVIPIFCKSCDFEGMPFEKLQGLPKDTKFIASQPDKDQAYTEVAKGIRKIVETRLS